MPTQKIVYGGWYQRTTLHLTEVYGFLADGFSKLDLSKEKLIELRNNLNLEEVKREAGYLEFVKAKTKNGIEIRYYEDGLYILEIESDDIKKAKSLLEDYFDNFFNPALNYIFSLGAPTPKVLANIKSVHPTAIGVKVEKLSDFEIDKKYGDIYSEVESSNIKVYKTTDYIFVVSTGSEDKIQNIIETQIFFREFKDQLEKYLNIHRNLWEEISDIKERKFIKGSDVEKLRGKLDQYQKTINLIGVRINQMGSYVGIRETISKDLKIEEYLTNLFQYKFESLSDTHSYIKEVWQMTKDYLSTAIDILKEIESKSVSNNILSLQIITSIGVVSGILGYLAAESLPSITPTGLVYLLVLAAIVWPINFIVKFIYKRQKYKITFPETSKNI